MTQQYLRKIGLVVTSGTKGLDLSQMKIHFSVTAIDTGVLPSALIRVYNLSATTAKAVEKEYQTVLLQAGYEGGFGAIFAGTITRIRRGRESAIDSFLDITAATGDVAYNYSTIAKTLAAGSSAKDRLAAITGQMNTDDPSVKAGNVPGEFSTGGILARGKVLFGLPRAQLDDLADSQSCSWSINPVDGTLNLTPLTGYLKSEAVVLNAQSGLIGVPESTLEGIKVVCLLNPLIKVGTRVQIDNAAINQTTVLATGAPVISDKTTTGAGFATVTDDGFYRVLVVEHRGDSRGVEWYSELTCLAIDASSSADNSVQAYG